MKMQSFYLALVFSFVCSISAVAQSDAIKYQGKLDDAGQPANGQYDLVFRLFDLDSGGTELAPAVTIENVQVTNGVFSAELSFSFAPFTSVAAQWLEIAVRPGTSTGSYTTLTPRQRITSAPYAMKSAYSTFSTNATTSTNSQQLGGIAASQYVVTTDPRLSDARQPAAGSASYIQNGTSQQASSNFNISGTGTANIFRASTQFNIGADRVLSNAGSFNLFAGADSGQSNSSGSNNSFFGAFAGNSNTSGGSNSFVGTSAGQVNSLGDSNSFVGAGSGSGNTTGSNNAFFGRSSGQANTIGSNNTLLGSDTNVGAGNLTNATAIGAGVTVSASNTVVLGRPADNVQIPGTLAVTGAISGTATNSAQLGGVAADQYVQTTDPRLTDARPPTAGSTNYIQNSTTAQAASNFNISGTGTANIFNAATQFNIGGNRVFAVPANGNSFLGVSAGGPNSTGVSNTFVGAEAGQSNTTAFGGVFVGRSAGSANTTGEGNIFIGLNSGLLNTTGVLNAFIGGAAGNTNTTGSYNTAIGGLSQVGSNNLTNSTAIGSRALASASNSLVLGSINGVNGATADTSVGIGTTAPLGRLDVRGQILVGLTTAPSIPAPNSLFIANDGGDANNTFRLDGDSNGMYMIARSNPGAAAGASIVFRTGETGLGETDRLRIEANGNINIGTVGTPDKLGVNGTISFAGLGTAGGTALCRNGQNQIAFCSSSLRYKTNIGRFSQGMSFVNQLRPISFDWKEGGTKDVGFGAEDIAKIDPRFVTYNAKGEVEGVKYDRLSVAFVNAFKEQQGQIELLKTTNAQQQQQLDELKSIVCSIKPDAVVCTKKEK